MIDVHTHLLPGIDDGAQSVEEALTMAEKLKLQGVTAAICTPHFNPATMSMDDFVIRRNNALKLLTDVKIKIIMASETYLHEYLFHYNDITPLYVSGTNYILIELPFEKKWNENILSNIEKLRYYYGVTPIIAHVERYPMLAKNNKSLHYLKELGCLMQINTETIMNKKYKKLIDFYMKNDYLDVLGTDCHNMTSRSPQMIGAKELIIQNYGTHRWDVLCENSKRIIGDR
ncbi:MAG: CpsB/CapC family capsule biosynthesis tyrosine phosphatase [Anaerocolumna sp.]